MASESEQEKRETLADIVAEIRRAVEYMGDDLPYTVSAGAMRKIASRIEAAWKRERAEIEANALACGGIVEASRNTQGNAAAKKHRRTKACDPSKILQDYWRSHYEV